MISSIVGMGSPAETGGGSGLRSQQRPVNLPYSFKSLESSVRSISVGFLDNGVHFLDGGNISDTAGEDKEALDFLFLH